MRKPSLTQILILAEIHNATLANGYPPSLLEISAARHLQPHSAWGSLRRLRRDGYLVWTHGKSRSYHVTPRGINLLWHNTTIS